MLVFEPVPVSCRDEWAEAIQMVAESLAKQEEEGILCSPTSQIENVNEEEMDTSISHYKRKVSFQSVLYRGDKTKADYNSVLNLPLILNILSRSRHSS